jgi:exosortase
MLDVARLTWTTEQGGHAPIIVATGAWLLWREWKSARAKPRPGNAFIGALLFGGSLLLYMVARITGILEIEGFAMYASLVSAAYLLVGGAMIRALWFPILYLAVALPPPDTVVAAITQPLKIGISEAAVSLLHAFGYPIASSGVTIQVANYQLLVAAACAGLNSIISLSAICLFYVYLRHRTDWVAFLIVGALIVPVAIFSNFVRVLLLVLITYYLGEAAAQGFLHEFAGLLLFVVALITILGADALFTSLRGRRLPA